MKNHIEIKRSSTHCKLELLGIVLADTHAALMLMEKGYPPVFYIPKHDIRMALLRENKHHTICPHKGAASYWDFVHAGKTIINIAWAYPNPVPSVAAIKDYLSFYPKYFN